MLNLDLEEYEPGHEAVAHIGAVEVTDPVESLEAAIEGAFSGRGRRSPAGWWIGYRASLLARSALSDTLTGPQKLRLSLELFGVTVLFALFWTAWVLAILALVGLML